jgi:hypothetical protein
MTEDRTTRFGDHSALETGMNERSHPRDSDTANPARTQVHEGDPTDQDWRAAGTEVREAVENARPQESPRPRHDRREEPER